MQIGVTYPQTELSVDPATVRAYVAGVASLGYRHVLIYDHVLGADPTVHRDWRGPYDIDTTFHEPLVFFGFLAAVCPLELVTGIVIAPQRQTALLAKQAAEVDILAEGRFRLGIGVGWNAVEYAALGQDFATRGQRQEEQIGLLRRLWTERSVSHSGPFDVVSGAGLSPRPVQQPIPVWLGGQSPAAYRRIGRLADGWFPQVVPGPALSEAQGIIASAATAAGRDPAALGMEGRISYRRSGANGRGANGGGANGGGANGGGVSEVAKHASRWADAGATHLTVNTMGVGLGGLQGHLDALGEVAAALGI